MNKHAASSVQRFLVVVDLPARTAKLTGLACTIFLIAVDSGCTLRLQIAPLEWLRSKLGCFGSISTAVSQGIALERQKQAL